MVFVLLAAGIVTTGYIYYRSHEQAYRAEVERHLSAIAALKVGELMQWREDRLSDAVIFFKNPSFNALVRRFFAQPEDADAQRQLLDWLGKYPTLDDYDRVRLLDTQGVERLSLPVDPEPTGPATLRGATEALQSGQITLKDFDRHKNNGRPYLAVLVPIHDESDGNRPLGVLVLRIDPTKYIYPFIERWPTPSQTAETVLVRRDGNDVLYLNDLRHQSNAALALRLPLTQTDVPAVRAVLGETGFMEGPDYRGVPVITIGRAVPNSPWILIAKMDRAEVYAPLRAQLWRVIVIIGLLLFSAGACVGLVWRQQRVRHYREQAEAGEMLRESDEDYRMLFHEMLNGYALHEIICDEAGNPSDYRFLAANPAFERMTGMKAAETVGRTVLEILPDTERSWIECYGKVALTGVPVRFENYAASMQKHFEVVAFRPKINQFACVFSDITERKRANEALRQKYAELERINNVTVGRELRMIELKAEINALLKAAGQPDKYTIVGEDT